jgi:hypothetical protein
MGQGTKEKELLMPGKKWRSIKPKGRKVYHGLRKRGMSKTQAAKIANAHARKKRKKGK